MKTSQTILNLISRSPLIAWLPVILLLGSCAHGYRGPLEVFIEVDEPNNEDFLVSIIFGVPGGNDESSDDYIHERTGVAGKAIYFPRASSGPYVKVQDIEVGEQSTAEMLVVVHHPYYEGELTRLNLPFRRSSQPIKVPIKLTHWDTRFAEMEEEIKLQPDQALQLRASLGRNFVRHIDSLKNEWVRHFSEQANLKLRKKYILWFEEKLEKYPEMKCQRDRIKRCQWKIKQGELIDEYKNTLPWQ